ncbi:CshA/CshB family fibrillar adhesin-related protein [Chitinophaga japonensis]|uniref:Gliding motility-associated-like protein n=1 Tax=Chitinophaga japonensis TaxID=104662 RepID=A0A562T0Z3_CHIJA|nr:CshA/CshB family fibrillar adhesin-related protein [Chitinophaga japonensis]TWI86884.1 gliding motility-associated-like protein [Chitinophaga japonensis]
MQPVSAQYATSGTGVLKNHIWWFDWAGFALQNGASRTFNTADGLTVTMTFSNVTGAVPQPSIMNTWSGAVLHFLYDFTNPAVQPALFADYTLSGTTFTVQISATRNGLPTPFTFVAADAEGSDLSEHTTLVTDGSNWSILELFRNSSQTSNPLTGCGTQTVILTDTYGGSAGIGQNPVLATTAPASGTLQVDVTFRKTVQGGMAIAFGIFAPVDRGDLPASYGMAQHALTYVNNNGCNYLPPLPGIVQSQSLMLGALPGDADPLQTTDDNASGADEDGVSSFQDYDGSGTYSVAVNVRNTTGSSAFLAGWFDYDKDGVFSNGEAVTAMVANNANAASLTWTGLPPLLPTGTVNGSAFRFRIASAMGEVQSPTGIAADGEVEDYFVPCSPISVTTTADATICSGQSVQLGASGGAGYDWTPATGLSDPAAAAPVAAPAATTHYTVTGRSAAGCSGTAAVTVNVRSLPVFSHQPVNPSVCVGDTVLLTAAGADVYTWLSDEDEPLASSAAFPVQPDVTTDYKIRMTDNTCNITEEQTVRVVVNDLPVTAVSKSNDLDCSNGQALLSATGGVSYLWEAADGIADLVSSNPVVSPSQTTVYHVRISDINGCSAQDSIQVNVDFVSARSVYAVPSAFSPNGDGRNDCFGLKYWGQVTSLDFSIYNRWGEQVFHSNNPNACWDGRYREHLQPVGAYVYQIKATTACGNIVRNGTVTLVL